MKSCIVSIQNKCAIICRNDQNEEVWVNYDMVPDEIKKQYNNCRKRQQSRFREALKLTPNRYIESKQHLKQEGPTFTSTTKIEDPTNIQETVKRQKRTSSVCIDDVIALRPFSQRVIDEIKQNIKHILQHFTDVKIVRIVGEGQHGTVFEICNPDLSSQRFIVKVLFHPDSENFEKEFRFQKIFYEFGLAVEPIGYFKNIMIMGKIDGILENLLATDQSIETLDNIIVGLIDLLTRMCEHDLSHNDLHFGNIGYQINIETREVHFVLLDFSHASNECRTTSQLYELIGDTMYISSHFNKNYLHDKLDQIPKF